MDAQTFLTLNHVSIYPAVIEYLLGIWCWYNKTDFYAYKKTAV